MSINHLLLACLLAFTTSLPAATLPTGPEAEDKAAAAKKILDKLIAAKGDRSYLEPSFVFSAVADQGASCKDGTITLDEQAYDVCAAMGMDAESALAMLLAHELIHHYEKHAWEGGFVSLVDPTSSADSRAISEKVTEDLFAQRKDEIEADYLGGFLAHLAGYPATNVMPRLLEDIYKAYNLNPGLSKYPPLKERQLIASQTHAKLQELIDVFEMGNLMAAIRQNDVAITYFEYILRHFQSREVYNNAGTVYARAAMSMFKKETLTFIYPLELDLQSRLGSQSRGVETDKAGREYFLRLALDHFRRAALLDPEYARAKINEGCALALLTASIRELPLDETMVPASEDYLLEAGIRARNVIRQSEKSGDQASMNNAHLLLGIIAAMNDDKTAAKASFAKAGAGDLAQLNKTILEKGRLPAPAASDGIDLEEKLNGEALSDIKADLSEWKTELPLRSGRSRLKFSSAHPAKGVSVFQHAIDSGRKYIFAAAAAQTYEGQTTMGIRIGDSMKDVIAKYDSTNFYTPVNGGLIMVYEQSGLAFLLQEGKVARWYLYLIKS
jgi:hypothetical protein